jgi:predicted nucleic acid-binding protein
LIEKVIDSSTLAKFLLKEKGWERVRDILRERPYTLDLAIKEAANAIWRRTVLLKDIDVEKALQILDSLLRMRKIVLEVDPQDLYLKQALKIAIDHGITIYDALFIAQALNRKAALATSDKQQCEIAFKLSIECIYIE